jgi:hypothetical protein
MTTFIQPQFDSIPIELQKLPRWVSWNAEGEPGDKPSKVPYAPDRINTRASSTDPSTWGTFTQAEASYLDGDRTGVGIVLNGDGLVGVDIDHCVTDGAIDPAAMALLDKLGAAYIELSPSGTGLRSFGYADGLTTGCKGKLNGLDVELYSTGRYLTLTGVTIKAGPIVQLTGFAELAGSIRADRKVNPATGKIEQVAPDAHHAELVRRVLSGDVYHDSLRDMAASLVATGMQPGAVVNHLRGLMDASTSPHDDRWAARRGQIPALVSSASVKFAPLPDVNFSGLANTTIDSETGEILPKVHPLARFVEIDGATKPPRWVIPGFIGHGVVVIAGAHGVGKTTALLPLALTAAGLHGGDLTPAQWRHVVYVTEDVEQAKRIVLGVTQHSGLGVDLDAVRERLHIVDAVRLDPAFVATVGKTYREQFTRLVDGVEVLPLVVLDTKSAVLAVDNENDNSEASAMMAALKQGFDGLPVWLVGHVAKPNLGRTDVTGLTSRGASAIEGDANQTMFLVREGESRFLVLGKTRFEPRWQELEITSYTAQTPSLDEFGNVETVVMRWGVAAPAQQTRKEAAEQAAALAEQVEAMTMRQDVRDAVETAWQTGNPINRAGVKAKVRRKASDVVATIENLLNERWLHEVAVPANIRANNSKSAFLVNLTTEEHEAVMAGAGLPADKLVIPESWQKQGISPVPAPESDAMEFVA